MASIETITVKLDTADFDRELREIESRLHGRFVTNEQLAELIDQRKAGPTASHGLVTAAGATVALQAAGSRRQFSRRSFLRLGRKT